MMKKMICLLLALTMALSLAACGGNEDVGGGTGTGTNDVTSSGSAQETDHGSAEPAGGEQGTGDAQEEPWTFTHNGVQIAMNAPAAELIAALGEPVSYTEETSCAFEGLDKTYYFGSFYVQTYPLDGVDYIYSVWLADDGVTTEEGLYIGASQQDVENLYGTDGYNGSNAYVITKGASTFTVILTDGVVSSIQYDAIVG